MRELDKILLQVEEHIKKGTYSPVETDKIEFKDLSTSDNWTELHKSICAFLNSKGGISVIGIKEDQKQKRFKFTGYNPNNEPKIKLLPTLFTDDENRSIDLNEFIRPDLIEIIPFYTGQICIVFTEKLPDELKYVLYKGEAYERQATGDHLIPKEKIQKQKELKEEIKDATELQYVPNTTLEDFDIDKLNDYIIRLNSVIKVEAYKADLQSALPFLNRKKFIRNGSPTLLGMLVCGKHIFDHIGGKCELDSYFETKTSLADDKKIYKDNIIPLMESGWNFTFSKIGTGISTHLGGTTIYEYPEDVVRETINNALAHRDYKSDRFSILRIRNNEFIEIRNPGKFRQEQLLYAESPIKLRRIIPFPKRQNANLADILKAYNRYEGRGIGMATLTNYALSNSIDVPYYRLYNENEIGLYIPKGMVLDENSVTWLKSFNKYIMSKTGGSKLSKEQETVLAYFRKSELMNEQERFTVNLTPDNNHFEVIVDLTKWKLLKELPQSTLEIKVFQIDPVLLRTDFSIEMRKLYGGAFEDINQDTQRVLEAIYLHNEFGTYSEISANLISNYLYFQKHSSINIDIQALGNFKRKVRSIINKLEQNGFIRRKQEGKPNYEINPEFVRPPSLFDEMQ
ncbi:MAG: putative DNA binding domain-containing protein [Sphingobacteriales bacterium]|nr:MAG: putative DNA binding domain-containing protein [Sphingobacteriales bacterium]